MKFQNRSLLLAFSFVCLGILSLSAFSGCASDKSREVEEDKPRVSTVPWNRPQGWEGQGQLGGMMGGR